MYLVYKKIVTLCIFFGRKSCKLYKKMNYNFFLR